MTDASLNLQRIETSRGPIEFAVAGSGPPVLYFHGTPCSSRVAVEMEQQLITGGFQLIVPQRPGYYGTRLGDRVTLSDCADVAAQVLDHLRVQRVALMGTSGGGPPALAFAACYPERTAALILQCAQVHRWDHREWAPTPHPWLFDCFRYRASRWLFCRFFPILFRMGFPSAEHYLRNLTGRRFPAVEAEPAAWQFAASVHNSLTEFHYERPGYHNDVSTWLRENVLSTGQVHCPTLLLHDREDPQAPFCHAEFAAAMIPNAKMVELNAGGHLIWFGPDAGRMHEERTAFLREHLAAG